MDDSVRGEISMKRSQMYMEWHMEDFFNFSQRPDSYHRSPPFTCLGLTWCLVVYPNGQRCHESVDFVGIYLKRIDNKPESIRLDFKIGFIDIKGLQRNIPKTHYFTENQEWGWHCFTNRHDLWRKRRQFPYGVSAFCIFDMKDAPTKEMTEGTATLVHNFRSLLDNEYKSDVVIKVKDQRFPAHKVILAARSPVFAAMFEHTMKENSTGVVDMADCDPEVVQSFLIFLYSAEIENITLNTVFGLLSLADQYDLEALKAECFKFIEAHLCVENACDALDVACKHGKEKLKKKAMLLLALNIRYVMRSRKWFKFIVENPVLATEILYQVIPA